MRKLFFFLNIERHESFFLLVFFNIEKHEKHERDCLVLPIAWAKNAKMKCASLFLLLLHRIIRWGYFLTSKDTKGTKGIAWVFVYCLGEKCEKK